MPLRPNTTCDIYRHGNSPPAAPDVPGVPCRHVSCYDLGRERGEKEAQQFRFTATMFVDITVDIRDNFNVWTGTASNRDTVYIPDKTGVGHNVNFVERQRAGQAGDTLCAYLDRLAIAWPYTPPIASPRLTHGSDTFLLGFPLRLHTTDSLLKKLGLTKAHTTDSLLKKPGTTRSHSADSLLKRPGTTRSHLTDSLFKKAGTTKSHSTDSMLKRLGLIKIHTTDSLFKKTSTLAHTSDSYLKRPTTTTTKTHTTDSLLKKPGNTKTITTDSLLKATGRTNTHTSDCYLS